MAKITLPTIAAGFASNTAFNTAFDSVEAEFQNKVLYRNNTSGETNTMSNALDMNSNAITNASSVTTTALVVDGADLTASVSAAATSAAAASTSAGAAATSATTASTAADNAQAAAAGIKWKEPVLCATTVTDGNLDLSGTETIDGISATSGKRVLVKNQTDPEDNGIYEVASGAWTRTEDAGGPPDNAFLDLPSAAVIVQQGSDNKDQIFICTTDPGGTLGGSASADEIVWSAFGVVTATSTSGLAVSGTALSVVPTNVTAAAFATDRGGADILIYGDASNSDALRRSTVAELAAALPVTTVAAGGTGASTFTDGALMIGNGTAAMAAVDLSDGHIAVGAAGTGNPTSVSLVDTARTWTAAQRGEVTTLTSAANIAIDMAVSNNFAVVMGHNITFDNTSNNTAGQSGSIFITQPGSGNHTASFGTDWDFPGGTAPTLSTAVNAVDRLDYIIKGVDDIQCVVTLAYS